MADDGRTREGVVPQASFSGLSATNVLFGRTWPQILIACAGLAIGVGGAAAGMLVPVMLVGVLVFLYGVVRWDGLSLPAWTFVWARWRRALRDGSTRWSYSPLASGRTVGVLGLWGEVEDRAQTVEGSSVEVVGTPFEGACYLVDPDRRQATAVLSARVEEWMLSSDDEKRSRALALNELTAALAEVPGVVELKETALVVPTAAPDPPDGAGAPLPEWARGDLAELWALPEVMTPLANRTYVSVGVNMDRFRFDRGEMSERDALGVALGGLVRDVVAPKLLDCGARRGSVTWCGVDALRDLVHVVADPEAVRRGERVESRDDPTVTWFDAARSGDLLTLDSCVARVLWVMQWPDRMVPAGWVRDLLSDGRMIAVTHIWRPLSMAESERDLMNKQSSIMQRSRFADQRRKSKDERREEREQRQRELEQEADWPDTDHQGLVVLFARDPGELAGFERDFRNRAERWRMRLNALRGQQREALQAALPLGL